MSISAKKKLKIAAIALLTCIMGAIIFSGLNTAIAETQYEITGRGARNVSGEMSVGGVTLYYYFKTVNNWDWGALKDTIDCKLDVEGNTIPCSYYLTFRYYDSNGKLIADSDGSQSYTCSGTGNNNYWTVWAFSKKVTRVTIKGNVSLNSYNVTVDLDLNFYDN